MKVVEAIPAALRVNVVVVGMVAIVVPAAMQEPTIGVFMARLAVEATVTVLRELLEIMPETVGVEAMVMAHPVAAAVEDRSSTNVVAVVPLMRRVHVPAVMPGEEIGRAHV